MRVVFMGTPDFSVPVLDALVAAGHEIAAVYCQPPRRAGRGQRLRPPPVQVCAEAAAVLVEAHARPAGLDKGAPAVRSICPRLFAFAGELAGAGAQQAVGLALVVGAAYGRHPLKTVLAMMVFWISLVPA